MREDRTRVNRPMRVRDRTVHFIVGVRERWSVDGSGVLMQRM